MTLLVRIIIPPEKRVIEEFLYENFLYKKFLLRKWGMRNEKSIFFIFNQNLAFFDDFSKFQIVLSIFHFYKAGKNEKKWKKDLLIILPVKNTVFHKFVVQLSSFYGVEFFSFFSRFSWGIPFFFSFLTRNSKPRKMWHVLALLETKVWLKSSVGDECTD